MRRASKIARRRVHICLQNRQEPALSGRIKVTFRIRRKVAKYQIDTINFWRKSKELIKWGGTTQERARGGAYCQSCIDGIKYKFVADTQPLIRRLQTKLCIGKGSSACIALISM